ncbi:WXG100 family type VII secretion target [Pseudonocardia sp. RS11V-5]|uniref:WXG100 family type VII secretion target n=1 Tax=Pseudonocardia terrae TaxID=2905831 RepID=UPI001E5F1A25|nr:WXG100 family type VII secretion target [Pseudonocardia terrae]MCE3552390.1 WXG100 family type VII secretion target [Pseudonocardia terrae]
MAQLAVTFEDLRTQSAAVQTGAADVNDILTRLTSQIADLAARWEGGASQAFQSRWQEWQSGAQSIQQAMDDMGRFLQTAADTYEQTEQGLQQAAGR